MPRGFDVLVCGSLHLDIVVQSPRLPRVDETAVGTSWRKVCGGKGGNQALQAARAGARTAMIGRVGRDDFADALVQNLRAAKVDTSAIAVDDTRGSGMSVAILQDDGEYGAVIVSGANLAIDAGTLPATLASLGAARVLVLQNEIPAAANEAAASAARGQGARVIWNAAPARTGDAALLDLVDVLVVNRIEAEAMTGIVVEGQETARAAAAKLAAPHLSAVVTMGGEGVVLAEAGGQVLFIPPVKVTAVSSHGAGDCFVGTLAAELARDIPLATACQTANARAAAFVSGKL